MSKETKITVGEGKYTFLKNDKDWRIHCLRYNEPWMVFEEGSNAISSLLYNYSELQAENTRLKATIATLERLALQGESGHNAIVKKAVELKAELKAKDALLREAKSHVDGIEFLMSSKSPWARLNIQGESDLGERIEQALEGGN